MTPEQQTRHQVPHIQSSRDACTWGRTCEDSGPTCPNFSNGGQGGHGFSPSLSDGLGCPHCRLLRLHKQVCEAGSVMPSARRVSHTHPFLVPVFPKPERRGWALSQWPESEHSCPVKPD